MDLITSTANPRIKQARALRRDRKARDESGLFVVEGIRPVGEAAEAGAVIEYLCYAPELLTSGFARALIETQSERGVPCYAVAEAAFHSIAEKENPQGLLAVVRQRRATLADLHPANFDWGVALVAPQDPGNVGTILRTLDAAGASGLILLDGGADPYAPGAVRASMGALFWHPVASARFDEFAAWANSHGYNVVGTSARADGDYRDALGVARPLVLLFGSEREGLTPDQAAVCRRMVRMPMQGHVTSLNLAVAAGIILYEVRAALDNKEGDRAASTE